MTAHRPATSANTCASARTVNQHQHQATPCAPMTQRQVKQVACHPTPDFLTDPDSCAAPRGASPRPPPSLDSVVRPLSLFMGQVSLKLPRSFQVAWPTCCKRVWLTTSSAHAAGAPLSRSKRAPDHLRRASRRCFGSSTNDASLLRVRKKQGNRRTVETW